MCRAGYPEPRPKTTRRRADRCQPPLPRLAACGLARDGGGGDVVPPTGRGVTRFISDPHTSRCQVCRRAFPRRQDGMVSAHKANGGRCLGSGRESGEDLAVASWLPVSRDLTPHGLRHGLKTSYEDQIADVLKSERLGHEEPGMRSVYGHVSPAMREEIRAALQARWEESLRQRARLATGSAVSLLGRLLSGIRPAGNPARSHLAPRIGHRERRNEIRRSPDAV